MVFEFSKFGSLLFMFWSAWLFNPFWMLSYTLRWPWIICYCGCTEPLIGREMYGCCCGCDYCCLDWYGEEDYVKQFQLIYLNDCSTSLLMLPSAYTELVNLWLLTRALNRFANEMFLIFRSLCWWQGHHKLILVRAVCFVRFKRSWLCFCGQRLRLLLLLLLLRRTRLDIERILLWLRLRLKLVVIARIIL